MKNKSETRQHIKNFHAFVSTQFGTKIKVIRSDNGSEFIMEDFYADKGIIHQKAYVLQSVDQTPSGPSLPNISISTPMPYAEFEQYTPEIVHTHFGMQNSELSPAAPSVQQNLDQDTCSHAVADELETTSPIVGSPSSQPRRSSRNRRIPNKFQDYYCDTIMKKVSSPHPLSNVISYSHLDMQHMVFFYGCDIY
nr:Retrovirus-related Pol polyprotein from transposon TNT 1-94 [Ipomoea batatas]